MPLETTLTEEEQKFFATGELQPGMAPAPAPEPAPAPPAPVPAPSPAPGEPPAAPSPAPAVNAETAEILQRTLEAAQARVSELETSIRDLQKPQPTAAPVPDRGTDPLGSMFHQLDTVLKTVSDLQKQLGEQREMQQQQTAFAAFQQQVNTLRDEFTKTTPDFTDAYTHLRNSRIADMRALGLQDADIRTTLMREEVQLAQRAVQQGKNPAAEVYEMAKRHGYVKTGAPSPSPAPADPNSKLDAIQRAQQASKNLPSTPQLDDITLDGLKGASDDDLNKIVNDPKLWGKITGADQYPL